jgi:hypothetical protein
LARSNCIEAVQTFALVLAGILGGAISSTAAANQLAILKEPNAVVVATAKGELQLWEKSAPQPRWSFPTNGLALQSESPIALLRDYGDGRILFVERFGRVMLVDPRRPQKATIKLPIMEWIKLGVNVVDTDWKNWGKQVEAIDRVAAAAADEHGNLLISSAHEPALFQIKLAEFFDTRDSAVMLSNWRSMFFADENFVMERKVDDTPVSFAKKLVLPTDERARQTAVAICGAKTIIGTNDGTVYFLPTEGNWKEEFRMRRLRGDRDRITSVLDVGCLGSTLAYTVTVPGQYGQVQLWDLQKNVLVDSVDTDGNGLPLYTYRAIPSADGRRLLALGDTHLRVWSVETGHLVQLGRQLMASFDDLSAATALLDGDFLLFDGYRLWTVSADGKSKTLFAGKPEVTK